MGYFSSLLVPCVPRLMRVGYFMGYLLGAFGGLLHCSISGALRMTGSALQRAGSFYLVA